MSEKESYIINWIRSISKLRPELNGFAVCPFASSAKYKIVECNVENICIEDGFDVIIFIIEDNLTLEKIQNWVEHYNSIHNGWKFFEDCGSYDTFINGIQTNNAKYNLILAQPTEKLKKFRKTLAKTSYYDLWEDDYLREILEDDYKLIDGKG